ncbi:MAG: glycine cleavage system H protein [Alteromonadaceae bacterium]|jgi:glycine cleavage system H protein
MSNAPADLRYAPSHEWVRSEGNGLYTVGITEHAQDLLGDMVFVEVPDIDDVLIAGDECGVVESVKAASDIYAPLSGKVVAINEDLEDSPENINNDAFGDGWMYKVQAEDETEVEALMTPEGYLDIVTED